MDLYKEFEKVFHETNFENIKSFFAPGRVNLIGEHTDYNGGHVFPCALSFGTNLLVRFNNTNKFRFYSANFPSLPIIKADINNFHYDKRRYGWANYCLGVINEFNNMNLKIDKGLDIYIFGDVPNGSGLSSSASLEVVCAGMLREMFKFKHLTDIDLALIGQQAENKFCNVKCGIMDQFASANGRKNCAIFLDCNTLEYKYAYLNLKDYKIVICNTNKKHSLNDSAYNERRTQCESGLNILKKYIDIKSLGDLSIEDFERLKNNIKDDVVKRRCKHAVYENQRTLKAVKALSEDDLVTFGKLMNESGDSLRYDFEVTCLELDVLVDLARKQKNVLGSRMTGGGFGGCTVNLVREDSIDEFIKNVKEEYRKKIGYDASFYIANINDGFIDTSLDAYIKKLVNYGIVKQLIKKEDEIYITNKLLHIFKKDSYSDPLIQYYDNNLDDILHNLLNYAVNLNLIEDDIESKDIFDTYLMDTLVDKPSNIMEKFNALYKNSPREATDYFHKFCSNSNYIRTSRIAKDIKYKYESKFGELDITINLSKPEKDPKDISKALSQKSSSNYPKCQLCVENVGYYGRYSHPARDNLRIINLSLNNRKYFLQYSPYAYFNEHCIVVNYEHVPMRIDKTTFDNLLDFVTKFPHYMVGSNADLPIVGGSILTHDHYQGGNYIFPMFKATAFEENIKLKKYPKIDISLLNWPLSVVRVTGVDKSKVSEVADLILHRWIQYEDKEANIIPFTKQTRHNTITPIVHMVENKYVMDLVLRNNRTDEQYPDGIFHVHPENFNIKKENIGLIEVMGLAVLPSRLKKEIGLIIDCIKNDTNPEESEVLTKHATFINEIKQMKFDKNNSEEIEKVVLKHVGFYFERGLIDCGVFKQTTIGREHFMKFVKTLNK